ncbi:phosphoenolpyruvate carboxykinase (ATP) [Campylobacter jejuni]|uniref:Phosphoenolpyruvate carboxykinase (ATP) n=1 Tax=Campylobacter jejuni TaxID=197 RepID=A0A5Y6IBF9_CAMJU|nr:phosphoenolpyruvate carboxykinase (ATP) [Campylobacter jejuni]ANS23970.1 phosphoenolpyruvate carboxykinase (ATP) [Campylobacter jejuni subsp. jejuni]EAH4499247.1 phosphoenolpyruvate carboxykinase (ATP) [Campylobacter jejuni]EAH4910084.1 phosphoenolpyruvate carboxykinase (ATP) [Campylobacter jejuni]EAH5205552.1 phosphoenolpyruvate carboxykinase (ATP) [Campylobacter jejuni]EAH5475335.1 phosphoenolpyruvate carboxykinase (ATP) [Campylobacter jejuni]
MKKFDNLGLDNIKEIFHNLSYDELNAHEKANNEGLSTDNDTFCVDTGIFTGRSPKDKYFVKQDPSSKYIAWGKINQPITKELFDKLLTKAKQELSGKKIYVQDAFCGASLQSRKAVRFVTEIAWQAHFVKNMFIRPSQEELENFKVDFIVYNACKCINEDYKQDGLNSEVFVIFNVEENIAVIGGTWYGGEMKKGIFSMMNYWLPLENKLSMHCSANVGEKDDVALFFGLSGTGKTTLSTDPKRRLIGDDEHGWDDEGVFNFEGGCYAKTINLDPEHEPEIYGAIKRNALLENVVLRADKSVDYADASKTENTRVSYPIEHIENHEPSLKAGHPKNIIFLSADAFGILPPVSKLSKEQAMYYFLSGYTAKVAGTERGITEPQATFSACFGEPFMPLHPTVYARLLGEKIEKHEVNVYLVNTGWSGGSYGVGKRMSIKATRACINAILDGSIAKCEFENFEVFNLAIPKALEGVESTLLNPINTWLDKNAYAETRDKLAHMFVQNFKRYEDVKEGIEFSKFGPKI